MTSLNRGVQVPKISMDRGVQVPNMSIADRGQKVIFKFLNQLSSIRWDRNLSRSKFPQIRSDKDLPCRQIRPRVPLIWDSFSLTRLKGHPSSIFPLKIIWTLLEVKSQSHQKLEQLDQHKVRWWTSSMGPFREIFLNPKINPCRWISQHKILVLMLKEASNKVRLCKTILTRSWRVPHRQDHSFREPFCRRRSYFRPTWSHQLMLPSTPSHLSNHRPYGSEIAWHLPCTCTKRLEIRKWFQDCR